MSDWMSLTTRSGNKPRFVGRRRGRPKKIMPRTKKDQQQDQQITQVRRKIQKINNMVDLGHKDTFINGNLLASDPTVGNGQLILLNGLVVGNTDVTRVKDLINITSIQFRGDIVTDPNVVTGTLWRMLIVMDRQSNGAAPVIADILDNTTLTRLIDAPYNDDKFPRFKILLDKRGVINNHAIADFDPATGTTTTMFPASTTFSYRIKVNPSKKNQTNYGLANGGGVADISTNSLYLVLMSNFAFASTVAPFCNAGVRIYFKDL